MTEQVITHTQLHTPYLIITYVPLVCSARQSCGHTLGSGITLFTLLQFYKAEVASSDPEDHFWFTNEGNKSQDK